MEGNVKYLTMNSKYEKDPSTFTTENIYPKDKKPTVKTEETTITKVIRVRFKDSRKKGNGLGRPTRLYELTTGDKVEYKRYNPNKNFSSAVDPNDFITEWERGKTPTPRPLRKYNNEKLTEMGYTMAEIHDIRGRTYSAKDIKKLRKALGGTKQCSADEARKYLDEHGSYHKTTTAHKDKIDAVRKNREKEQKNVTHMGKYTHGKAKKPSKNKPAKSLKRKMTKSQKKKGRRGF
jgi:hypothetical protein